MTEQRYTRIYREDLGLYAKWVKDLLDAHCHWSFWRYRAYDSRHIKINGIEVDYMIKCIMNDGKEKTIIVEFKGEQQWGKVLEQAIQRRKLAKYMYIAMDMPSHKILSIFLLDKYFEKLVEHGIGLISLRDKAVVLKSYSTNRERYGARYKKIGEFIEKQENEGDDE